MTLPQGEHYRCNSRCPPKPSIAFLCSGGVLQVLEVTITSRFFSVAKSYHSKTLIVTVFEKSSFTWLDKDDKIELAAMK